MIVEAERGSPHLLRVTSWGIILQQGFESLIKVAMCITDESGKRHMSSVQKLEAGVTSTLGLWPQELA